MSKRKLRKLKKSIKYGDVTEIARRTGYHIVSISRMLNGARPMHPDVLQAFEELLRERSLNP